MAISRSDYQLKAIYYVLGFFCLMVLLQKGDGLQFTVGGAQGWSVPYNSTGNEHNLWAERTRFQIGDSLLFIYKPDQDSVLLVNKYDYDNCTTTAALATYNDGHTVFTFNRSGHFYFITGNKDNCLKNQKLVIAVLADRSNRSSPPPPSGDMDKVPSPAPSGAPSGTVENIPTTSPVSDTPKNAGSSMFVSLSVSVVGAFFASYVVLVC